MYGNGEYGTMPAKIYHNKKTITKAEYDKIIPDDMFSGADFGNVHPTAFMEYKYYKEKVFGHLRYYESNRPPEHLVKELQRQGVSKNMPMYVDPNFPDYRRKLEAGGFNAIKAKKEAGSVLDGIKLVSSLDMYVTTESTQYWKENNKYSWQQASNGNIIEKPIKIDDDAMDAERYACRGAQCLRGHSRRGLG